MFSDRHAAEVTPVRQIGDYRFTPGETTRELVNGYAELVNGAVSYLISKKKTSSSGCQATSVRSIIIFGGVASIRQ